MLATPSICTGWKISFHSESLLESYCRENTGTLGKGEFYLGFRGGRAILWGDVVATVIHVNVRH